jgi:uncharacterized LabA/DUF88 family protein
MQQVAVFVDAGYLHAQGSALLTGQKKLRPQIILDVRLALEKLQDLSESCATGSRLLRTYWYDGLTRTGRLSSEQEQIANAPFAKLRLGTVNSRGEQKGVDSLIVTDLIDLARNRAITDAVLVSGDEDIRIGVQIAQTFGVRIHLLGIKPARGSQSPDLIQEADSHHEWTEEILKIIMSFVPDAALLATAGVATGVAATAPVDGSNTFIEKVQKSIDDTLDSLEQPILDNAIKAFKSNTGSVPPELDRPTLGRLRSVLGRDLSEDERKSYRAHFRGELSKL